MTNFKYYNKDKTKEVRNEIESWVNSLKPNYVLTVQFPPKEQSTSYDISQNKLKSVMGKLEYHLRGKEWQENHIPFIAFCETGKLKTYHYHIFFYGSRIKSKRMDAALAKVFIRTGYTVENMYLDPDFTLGTPNYCTKQIYSDTCKHFDTANIITSEQLFDIPVKQPIQSHKPSVDSRKQKR